MTEQTVGSAAEAAGTAEKAGLKRRSLVSRLGGGLATAAAVGSLAAGGVVASTAAAQAQGITDADIFNFALNLEYLQAEFYLRAIGSTLGAGDIASSNGAAIGEVRGGSAVPFRSASLRQYAEKIASDELAHVRFIRAALSSAGAIVVPRPTLDLGGSFTTVARAAGLVGNDQTFNPFADEISFLLGAFIFEDVGVTAYSGAAALIQNKTLLSAAASVLAVEAYHAGAIRTLLAGINAGDAINRISALRARLSGADDERPILTPTTAFNFVPTDPNGLTYRRTPRQVLNIVYGGGSIQGGFLPDGMTGNIRS